MQVDAFCKACVDAVKIIAEQNVSLLVVGNDESKFFPKELKKYKERKDILGGGIKVNFLVNYGWKWDIGNINTGLNVSKNIMNNLKSKDISRIDLIIRWGGRRRLSGLLPIQSVYSDFYVLDEMWPDFSPEQFYSAISWYDTQDVTLGG